MATLHFHENTTATPEQLGAGVTDFGPRRSELFQNSADGYLKVHSKGATEADVTEGSTAIWERLHYHRAVKIPEKRLRYDARLRECLTGRRERVQTGFPRPGVLARRVAVTLSSRESCSAA